MLSQTKHKSTVIYGRKGAALLLTLIVMITLISVVGAYLGFVQSSTRSIGAQIADSQAIYLADAGLQHTFWTLDNDSDFRSDPVGEGPVTGNLGAGSYSVFVTREGSTYTLTSTGMVNGLSREITQSVIAASAVFDYAVFVNTNNLTLDNIVVISGDIYCNEDVEVTTGASAINGLVYADNVTGSGTYTEAPGPPDPVPTYPAFNTTSYDAQITTAESQASEDLTIDKSSTHNLNGGTEYYKKLTVQGDPGGQLIGPGTIVTTDNVELKNSGLVTSNVTIITKKKILMSNDGNIDSGALTYAREGFILQDDAIMAAANIIVPTSGQTIEMKGNSQMTGAVYANHLKLQDNVIITGSVVTNTFENNKIQNNASIIYSEDVLGSIPTGMESANVTLRVQTDWNEI